MTKTETAEKKARAEVELIPLEVLFGNPERANPQISPDGKKIAYLAPVENVLNVWVKTIGSKDDRPVTKDRDRGIRGYFWAQNNEQILYLQDAGGNENWRLYAVGLKTGKIRDMTPFEGVQVQVLSVDKHFPREILIAMNKEDPKVHDAYRLDLRSAKLSLAAKNPGNFLGWLGDSQMKVRAAVAAAEDGGFDLMVRESEKGPWKKAVSWDSEDSLNSGPVAFSKDGKSIYLRDSRGANAGRLVELELETGKIRVVAEDPEYDVGGVMMNPETYEPQMVSFLKARNEWVVLDPSLEEDVKGISCLHAGDFFIASRDNSDRTWLVGYTVDSGPVPFYAFDRKSRKGAFLFYHKPDLGRYRLSPMEPVSFKAKDGLTLHGYVTFPPGKKGSRLPMVLNVHGGPWARDTWGYDPEAQWLANRGYVCLQVNFRGSTGYGKKFLNAGDREWGGKMHQDLVDAVRWAVEKGYADPEKTAIYGGSYGGYAALVGAAFTPELFRCAVDIVGPSNLITLIKTIPPYWSSYLATFYKRVGHPEKDAEFLRSRSPLFKVDRIKVPILVAQGANDPRVKQNEAEQIVKAMKEKGIACEYLLFPDEGHGLAKPQNRLKFYRAAERFLARNLGGRIPTNLGGRVPTTRGADTPRW